MGLFDKFTAAMGSLVDEVPTTPPMGDPTMGPLETAAPPEPAPEVATIPEEFDSVDVVIAGVYGPIDEVNGNNTLTKVSQLLATYPNEMPLDTKRKMAAQTLAIMGLDLNRIRDDGEARIKGIRAEADHIRQVATGKANALAAEAEEHRKAIEQCTRDQAFTMNYLEEAERLLGEETKRLTAALEFAESLGEQNDEGGK